jgi:heme-degrading monooxygenase HmoA
MILEIANLSIVPGKESEFEAAFSEAKELLDGIPGFIDLDLQRCIEQPNRYALLAHWQSVEDHTEGFRGSEAFKRWRELLGPFFEPMPEVSHYRSIADE